LNLTGVYLDILHEIATSGTTSRTRTHFLLELVRVPLVSRSLRADLADISSRIRSKLNKKADLRRAIARDNSADFKIVNGVEAERLFQTVNVLPRANFRFDFPSLETTSSLQDLAQTGWEAGRYGIPEDIIAQTDRATLWASVCTAEALNASGITDPYELYMHMHPSEVGTCIGSGMGGVTSMAQMFKDR
jgi:3-oxoacyl-(acyl-carrier-protein) synthase